MSLNDAFGDGVACQPGDIVNAELVHDLLPVLFDGLNTDAQVSSDLFIRAPLREQLKHLCLACRQIVGAPAGAGSVFHCLSALVPQAFGDQRAEIGVAAVCLPPVPREVEKYSLSDRRRLATKPGITCIWQISGRSEIDFSGQVKLDVDHIESQTLWMDLKILVQTIPAVLSGKGAC